MLTKHLRYALFFYVVFTAVAPICAADNVMPETDTVSAGTVEYSDDFGDEDLNLDTLVELPFYRRWFDNAIAGYQIFIKSDIPREQKCAMFKDAVKEHVTDHKTFYTVTLTVGAVAIAMLVIKKCIPKKSS
ncbi:MAG: hypothetical protein WCT20_00835 [Candidatus Babeliales bacterium]